MRCNVRKTINGQVFLAVALALFATGCGGGPTAPSKPAAGTLAISTPTPAPTPEPAPTPAPAPAPAPPPAPTPAPAPTPPEPVTRYTAHVDVVHWFGAPLFTSPTFEITRYADRIVLGSVSLPILYQDDRSLIARTSEMTFSIVDAGWTFNGIQGAGAGTLSK